MKHWVVVADPVTCRIFETDETLGSLALVQALLNDPVQGPAAALERPIDPEAAVRARFARAIAHRIDAGLADRAWERLVLVAPARLLGDLRSRVTARARERVVASIHRDPTSTATQDLPLLLRRHLHQASPDR